MKKEYIMPLAQEFLLLQESSLMVVSQTSTNLDPNDEIEVVNDNTPFPEDFPWGR